MNSAVPRAVLERFPFADDVVMSEDQEWSRRVLLAGLEIVYEPRAVVRHSHAYSLAGAFRRFFDSGASAGRTYVSEARGVALALRRAGARYALGEVALALAHRAPPLASVRRRVRVREVRRAPARAPARAPPARAEEAAERAAGALGGAARAEQRARSCASASSTTISSRRPSAARSAGCATSGSTWRQPATT